MKANPSLLVVLSLSLAVCLTVVVEVSARKNIICYFGSWSTYRPGAGKFDVENIDPMLCTHVLYAFTGLSDDGTITVLDAYNDLEDNYGKGAMKKFTNLKQKNPSLKTIVAIGGWNEGSTKFSNMASSQTSRAKFIDSVVSFLAKYNFDGLDLDWEYPAARGGGPADKQNFVSLTRELSDALKPRGYLLTAAVSASRSTIDAGYDIAQISKYLDLINLMTYDYHGSWDPKTGLNAPLYSSPKYDLSSADAMLNVNYSVNYWLSQGASREKLMLGVGSYGRSFTLDNGQVNGLNAPAGSSGQAGPYTREAGTLGYNEICDYLNKDPSGWKVVRDPDYQAPYAYRVSDRQWVGYDDPQSLALKAQFANKMGLGGMMMWSIETDDFQGTCSGEKYPLLNQMKRTLDGGDTSSGTTSQPATTARPTSSQTSAPATTTTAAPTTAQQQGEFVCRSEGYFTDPQDCRKFIRCVKQGDQYQAYRYTCGQGTAFNQDIQACDYIANVPACKGQNLS